jgi:DNA polymerase I
LGGKRRGFLLSVTYDGQLRKAIMKFLTEDGKNVFPVEDPTDHKPYCLSTLTEEQLKSNRELVSLPGIVGFDQVRKFNALSQKEVVMTKIVAADPLSIGGKPSGTVRSVLRDTWEADIAYVLNYIYDLGLRPGQYYDIEDGNLKLSVSDLKPDVLTRLQGILNSTAPLDREMLEKTAILLEQPVSNFRRVALDIEVLPSEPNRLPDANEPRESIVAIAMMDDEGMDLTFLLASPKRQIPKELLTEPKVRFFDNEKEMLMATFKLLNQYPLVITFNGDNFDLPYLRGRARALGVPDGDIPLRAGRDNVDMKVGVHVDLYRFFYNRSIQIYAFSNAYKEATLDAISNALIGKGKLPLTKPFGELSYEELWLYCRNDAAITLELTTYNGAIVMNLIVMLMRISRAPMEEIVRRAVSSWIRSLFIALHRERGMLIPNQADILKLKGGTVTTAIIKGKKYKGAIVLQPTPGAHFNVVVMDFASLYPSVIARYNLSYETVRCPHPECRDNKVADLPHWVCTKVKGITSSVIGTLRDLRVKLYIPLSKEATSQLTAKRYEVIQRALKVFLNASYGVMGAESFQFYTPPVAESVTALGRKILTEVISEAQKRGTNVIYGDTDSAFLERPSEEEIEAISRKASEDFGIQLNFDKKYRYVVFSTRKKNYFGVTEDGIVDVKGLMGKKSSTPAFVKEVFNGTIAILSGVKDETQFEQAKEKVGQILKDSIDKLKRREVPVSSLSFNVMMSKDIEDYKDTLPQHIKAAIMTSRDGTTPGAGSVISYVKVKGRLGVKPTQTVSPEEIDVDKYLQIFETTCDQFLEPLGIDISSKGKSSKLVDFM